MNKKGFLTIIVILAIFSIGIIIILGNQINHLEKDYTNNLVGIKNKIANYSLSINLSAQNCFKETEVNICIDSNSSTLIEMLNLNEEPYNCTISGFNNQNGDEYLGRISCNYRVYSETELFFSNEFFYDIVVKEVN